MADKPELPYVPTAINQGQVSRMKTVELLQALSDEQVQYVLVGGLANCLAERCG